MKLTPLDIKKQEFTRSFRGVDAQEVYNFLQMVGDQWDNLLDENRRLEQKVREYDNKLEHYRKIEEALQEALETARDNSHKTIENAQREAQIILKEARSASEEIRKKASTDHKRLKHDISKISGRRDEVVARLRAFLMSELELLSRFEGPEPLGYGRLDVADSKQLRGRSSNEININAMYHSHAIPTQQHREPVVDLPVDLPVDEEEAAFEEEQPSLNDTFTASTTSAVNNSVDLSALRDEPVEPASPSSEGLSTDELEFIKSTVSSATQQPVDDDIFKPAEPEVDEAWHRTMANNFPPNGQNGQPRSATPSNAAPRAQDGSGAGWIVKPTGNTPQGAAPNARPSNNKPNLGGFASPLFGTESDQDDLSATPEEIEKIRRILNDLD
ncbi:MAG: DivIVA domain-containing protein [Rhodothermales bacterium]